MTTTLAADTTSAEQRDALAERLFNALIQTFELTSVYLGLKLDLYAALREGPATVEDLAAHAGVDQRYAREWLEQQAVAGLVEAGEGDAETRAYTLPIGHAEVLLDGDNPAHLSGAPLFVGSIADVLPDVLEAYRTGKGIPYADYGADCRHAIAEFNRPMFVNELTDWVASIPGLKQRLTSTTPARVLDIGCGAGWSSVALARAFPNIRIEGVDLDEASIAEASRLARKEGVAERVSFRVADAAEMAQGGRQYDVAFMFETLHDMARPVEALQAVRALLAEGGMLIITEEKVAESFTAPGDEVERLNYGFSVWHCLPASRAEDRSAAVGTVLRPDVLLAWAEDTGYDRAHVVPVDNDLWRFYQLEVGP